MSDVKPSGQGTKPLTIRVPTQLHREARVLSVKRDESLNSLVVKWLSSWVDHHREELKP